MRKLSVLHWSLVLALSLASPFALAHRGGDHENEGDEDDGEIVTIPAAIAVPAGNVLFLVAYAEGTQNYACNALGAWAFVAPAATLYDEDGDVIGLHYAGPTWELNSGSKVVGARIAGVTVDPTAIPWLLLGRTSSSTFGKLEKVTYIQRVSTVGGLAPAGACTPGDTAAVPYTATYYFYRAAH